jgi:hypothetical protein
MNSTFAPPTKNNKSDKLFRLSMKRNLHFALLLFALQLTSNWANAQSESYKTLEDDPSDIKNLTLHLDPFYADAWLTNTTLGFGVRADYHLGKRATFLFDFRTPYPGTDFQGRMHYDQELPYPSLTGDKRGLARFSYTELGAEFHLMDWTKSKGLRVVLSSYSTGRTTTTTSMTVPGTKRKVLAVRGGFTTMRSAFDIQDTKGSVKAYHDKDTITFGAFGVDKGGGPIYGGYANITMVVLHAGISIKSITNLVISTTNYGNKGNRAYSDFYFDLLLAPVISLSDVVTANGTTYELRSNSLTRTGFRFGYTWKNSVKSYLSYKAEIGSRPGFPASNFFLNGIIGWSIPLNIKVKAAKTE